MERRLAAVLAADMAGYSRLMEADEQGTLARLRAHRVELFDPLIAENLGRIIKTTGDGMLVEFPSVTDAVVCAVEIQQRMQRRNVDIPDAERIQFRIGINLGDIIFEDDDIFGDGVNVAARLEGIAEVGGVCVSAAVRDQVAGRMEIALEDLGEQHLKNISRPVRAYRVELEAAEPAGGGGATAGKAQPLVKPSVAVLPFANMSGDPEQEFFADGLTEDILTELSRRRELFVISRNSTFVYKGQAVNIREVAGKLGARYVVEGSVRKAGNRVRVTVQLIDTANDMHIWAEKYDRQLDDIFEIQDEITGAIVATLPGWIEQVEHDHLARKKPSSLAAWECVLAAKVLHHRSEREANAQAQELVERAITLDPEYAHAYAWRGCIRGQAWGYGWCDDPDAMIAAAAASTARAAALDDNDADVHRLLAAMGVLTNDLPQALRHQERALALNPNYDLVVVQMGEVLTWLGRPEEGIDWIRRAMRLNPHHPARFWSHLGRACFTARRYDEAIDAFMRFSPLQELQLAFLAASHGWLGDADAARAQAAKLRGLSPEFDTEGFLATMHYGDEADLGHLREGLAKAGLAGD